MALIKKASEEIRQGFGEEMDCCLGSLILKKITIFKAILWIFCLENISFLYLIPFIFDICKGNLELTLHRIIKYMTKSSVGTLEIATRI